MHSLPPSTTGESQPEPTPRPAPIPSEDAMNVYVSCLAGWFSIAQLAAGRRLERAGVRTPLLND